MPPVQVLAAIAEHPCHAIGEWSRAQEADQVAGGLVGPVHVLDDEQERRLHGGRLAECNDTLEDLMALPRALPGVPADTPASRAGSRPARTPPRRAYPHP